MDLLETEKEEEILVLNFIMSYYHVMNRLFRDRRLNIFLILSNVVTFVYFNYQAWKLEREFK